MKGWIQRISRSLTDLHLRWEVEFSVFAATLPTVPIAVQAIAIGAQAQSLVYDIVVVVLTTHRMRDAIIKQGFGIEVVNVGQAASLLYGVPPEPAA